MRIGNVRSAQRPRRDASSPQQGPHCLTSRASRTRASSAPKSNTVKPTRGVAWANDRIEADRVKIHDLVRMPRLAETGHINLPSRASHRDPTCGKSATPWGLFGGPFRRTTHTALVRGRIVNKRASPVPLCVRGLQRTVTDSCGVVNRSDRRQVACCGAHRQRCLLQGLTRRVTR